MENSKERGYEKAERPAWKSSRREEKVWRTDCAILGYSITCCDGHLPKIGAEKPHIGLAVRREVV